MGLMDVINGMQNGPRGARGGTTSSSGSMSPITMAVLGLLAYKALKSFTGQSGASPAAPAPGSAIPPGKTADAGGLGGLLKGGLGGLLTGGAAGSVLSGGLNDLLKQFQDAGHGNTASSWIGTGPNSPITPDALSKVLDSDQIKTLMDHSGLTRDELLSGLSQYLPQLVNELTPDGRLPTAQEASRLL